MDSNQTLQLRDIHLPSSPDIWPPAPGWWLLATLILFLIGWSYLKYSAYRRRKQLLKQQRQTVFEALKPIEEKLLNKRNEDINKDIGELNILLRQLALMHFPQNEIASLSGKQWLAFLDKSGATQQFSDGAGRLLADIPYQAEAKYISQKEAKALIELVKSWIQKAEIIS